MSVQDQNRTASISVSVLLSFFYSFVFYRSEVTARSMMPVVMRSPCGWRRPFPSNMIILQSDEDLLDSLSEFHIFQDYKRIWIFGVNKLNYTCPCDKLQHVLKLNFQHPLSIMFI